MVESSEGKKEFRNNEQQEVTVDDLIPVVQELLSRIEHLEQEVNVLKNHEHGVDGKPVIRLG